MAEEGVKQEEVEEEEKFVLLPKPTELESTDDKILGLYYEEYNTIRSAKEREKFINDKVPRRFKKHFIMPLSDQVEIIGNNVISGTVVSAGAAATFVKNVGRGVGWFVGATVGIAASVVDGMRRGYQSTAP